MALPANLKANLRRVLRGFGAANSIATVPGGSGKALEAWVYMRLAMAARATGHWSVSLRRGDGTLLPPGDTFAFATSQSGIQAASQASPCYVLLEHRNHAHKRLELHGSLQWRGRSNATHEIDVSAIPAVVAEALRSGGGGLPRGLPVVAIECKDKTSAGVPDEMRQTLARMFDLALVTSPPWPVPQCRIYEDVSGAHWGQRSATYRDFFSKGTFAIVRVGVFSLGARRIASHYHIQRTPSTYGPGGNALAGLEASFRSTLASLDLF